MWMHNGGLGGWKQIKRRLGERLADKWYLGVVGGTDSEWAFALFLDTLERMGYDPSSQPVDGFSPTVLRKAMLKTIALINELIDSIPESTILAENVDTRSLLNFALSDGHTVICTRYVGSSSDEAASLYYSSGTLWETRVPDPDSRDYQMARSDMGADVVLVASEPLTFERGRQTLRSFAAMSPLTYWQKTGSTSQQTPSSRSTTRLSSYIPSSTSTMIGTLTTAGPPPLSARRAWRPTRRRWHSWGHLSWAHLDAASAWRHRGSWFPPSPSASAARAPQTCRAPHYRGSGLPCPASRLPVRTRKQTRRMAGPAQRSSRCRYGRHSNSRRRRATSRRSGRHSSWNRAL